MKNYSLGSIIRATGWGVLLGGCAGLAAGLLVAPEDGRRMRRRISYRLESLGKRFNEVFGQVMTPGMDGSARRHGNELVADACKRAQVIRSEIDEVLGQFRQPATTS